MADLLDPDMEVDHSGAGEESEWEYEYDESDTEVYSKMIRIDKRERQRTDVIRRSISTWICRRFMDPFVRPDARTTPLKLGVQQPRTRTFLALLKRRKLRKRVQMMGLQQQRQRQQRRQRHQHPQKKISKS